MGIILLVALEMESRVLLHAHGLDRLLSQDNEDVFQPKTGCSLSLSGM